VKPRIRIDENRLKRAFAVAQEGVESGEVPSAVVAVATGSTLVDCWAFTRKDGDTVANDSIFLLASITKPILATAVMRLIEDGRLALFEPIERYIPEFAQPGKPAVTAWHLLTHTSGIEEETSYGFLAAHREPASAYLEAALRSTIQTVPGTQYRYCSLSFYILAELITRLSGMPYADYLRAQVFEPLGMSSTGFDPDAIDPARRVPVRNTEGRLPYFISLAAPGGGLWSTAADLVTFGQAFLNDGLHGSYHLLSPAWIETMTQEHTTGLPQAHPYQSEQPHYGLGWQTKGRDPQLPGSPRAFCHNGVTGTQLWIDPTWDLVCVFLTNEWGLEHSVRYRVVQAVYSALRPM
jgi:CubicO group peptidase (beta-lactamase class C family)